MPPCVIARFVQQGIKIEYCDRILSITQEKDKKIMSSGVLHYKIDRHEWHSRSPAEVRRLSSSSNQAVRTMAATRCRFRQRKLNKTNNPPLYSSFGHVFGYDDTKNRLIVLCDPAEFDSTTTKNNQHNTTVNGRRQTPISITKIQVTRQSNIMIACRVFFYRGQCGHTGDCCVWWVRNRVLVTVVVQHNKKKLRTKVAEFGIKTNKLRPPSYPPSSSQSQSSFTRTRTPNSGWLVRCRRHGRVVCCHCCVVGCCGENVFFCRTSAYSPMFHIRRIPLAVTILKGIIPILYRTVYKSF